MIPMQVNSTHVKSLSQTQVSAKVKQFLKKYHIYVAGTKHNNYSTPDLSKWKKKNTLPSMLVSLMEATGP